MMTLNRFVMTTAFFAAATLASTVSAQERDAKKREATRSAQEKSAKGDTRGESRQSRETDTRRADTRRDYSDNSAAPRAESRRDAEAVRAEKYREADRREYHRDAAGRYYYNRNHYAYAPRVYYRPYVFRPYLSISFGIFAGYPVPYSYSYAAPIIVYGYRAPRVPVYVAPGSPYYGGVSLEIGPYDADVFVDGSYAGHVEDFDGTRQPLTLVAGTHRIEVQAPGFAPLVFDVTVKPGQVIPYRGDLRQS